MTTALALARAGWRYIDQHTWAMHHDRHGWVVLRWRGHLWSASMLADADDGPPVESSDSYADTPRDALRSLSALVRRHDIPRAAELSAWVLRLAEEVTP